ncbi:protein of unknown function [Actinobaculum suis]|uniref:DUF2017 family protein n=1 Tax=Actinobaculum suis TaxID=1657 RepID=A0A1G7D7P0_9ACTO|nr:DUF2017 family protein [Actinobaculum suis]MDY5153314.1 DUF2017 family protein [Actinobaculum suis]SDE47553.1 protein of unknown function [Actinobaculum suis]
MKAFLPWRGGYMARADEVERRFFSGIARDVAHLLGRHLEPLPPTLPPTPREPEDILEAYAAELADLAELAEIAELADPAELDEDQQEPDLPLPPLDNALIRLLPDMAEDPDMAYELRAITEESIRTAKVENLRFFTHSLQQEAVWVGNEDVRTWAGAANDIRLVLAARLGIHSEETAYQITEKGWRIIQDTNHQIENSDDLMCVLYVLLSWWQDSLIRAVQAKKLRG